MTVPTNFSACTNLYEAVTNNEKHFENIENRVSDVAKVMLAILNNRYEMSEYSESQENLVFNVVDAPLMIPNNRFGMFEYSENWEGLVLGVVETQLTMRNDMSEDSEGSTESQVLDAIDVPLITLNNMYGMSEYSENIMNLVSDVLDASLVTWNDMFEDSEESIEN